MHKWCSIGNSSSHQHAGDSYIGLERETVCLSLSLIKFPYHNNNIMYTIVDLCTSSW